MSYVVRVYARKRDERHLFKKSNENKTLIYVDQALMCKSLRFLKKTNGRVGCTYKKNNQKCPFKAEILDTCQLKLTTCHETHSLKELQIEENYITAREMMIELIDSRRKPGILLDYETEKDNVHANEEIEVLLKGKGLRTRFNNCLRYHCLKHNKKVQGEGEGESNNINTDSSSSSTVDQLTPVIPSSFASSSVVIPESTSLPSSSFAQAEAASLPSSSEVNTETISVPPATSSVNSETTSLSSTSPLVFDGPSSLPSTIANVEPTCLPATSPLVNTGSSLPSSSIVPAGSTTSLSSSSSTNDTAVPIIHSDNSLPSSSLPVHTDLSPPVIPYSPLV